MIMNGIVTDFSGADNAIIEELAGRLLDTYIFNARIQNDPRSGSGRRIKIKIINGFNYVTHVYFTTDAYNILQSCECDGNGIYCGNAFCGHCRAAYEYLKESGEYPVFLPEQTKDAERYPEHSAETPEYPELSADAPELNGAEVTDNDNDTAEAVYSETEEPSEPRCMKILLGTDRKTGEPVFLMPNNTEQVLNNNIGIIGTMGTGKTQFTKSLVAQFCRSYQDNYDGTPLGILIFDYKGDYNETKPDFIDMTVARVIRPYRMPFNPLSLNLREKNNKALLPRHTANAFKDTISKIYNLGPRQEGVLFDCIMAAYEKQGIDPADPSTWRRPAPTFRTVYEQYRSCAAFNDGDKLAVVMKKLEGFEIFCADPHRVSPLSGLLRGVTVMDISDYDEDIQNLVVAITLDLFYAQMQTYGSSRTNGQYRQLRTFILVDEADNFMKMNFPSLRKIMKEGREFGVGVILSTQSLTHFCAGDDDYSKYIITWVIHKVNDLNRRNIETVMDQTQKSAGTEELFLAIKELKKHESIVKISGSEPVLMEDKPFWQLCRSEGIVMGTDLVGSLFL